MGTILIKAFYAPKTNKLSNVEKIMAEHKAENLGEPALKATKKKKKGQKLNQFKVSIKFYDHQKILVPNCDQLTIGQLVHEAEKRYKSTVEPCCRVKIFRLKTEAAEILYMEDNVKDLLLPGDQLTAVNEVADCENCKSSKRLSRLSVK